MSKFIEVTINDGIKILINKDVISSVVPKGDGSTIYLLKGEKNYANVVESYDQVKVLLNT